MATQPIDFDMKPGQVLCIPSGAMHEVTAYGMPQELMKELSGVLQSQHIDLKTKRTMLRDWWTLANSRTMYQGPYPERI